MPSDLQVAILAQMADAESKAWEALGGYKFWMFGYHAGRWVNYNNLLPADAKLPSPFRCSVHLARQKRDELDGQLPLAKTA
jgi:hypothetical protein